MDDYDGEDGTFCRICRLPASYGHSLFSPCKCSGSIKYVHQDCLISWLNQSGHQHCELCRHKFKFRPVYAPGTPSRIPWSDLIWGLAVRSASGFALFARLLAVVATWLFVVPLLTCWMWRLAFLTSLAQGMNDLCQRLQPVLILADCIQGSLISLALILMVLFTTYTADHIRAYWHVLQPQNPAEEVGREREREPELRAHPLEDDDDLNAEDDEPSSVSEDSSSHGSLHEESLRSPAEESDEQHGEVGEEEPLRSRWSDTAAASGETLRRRVRARREGPGATDELRRGTSEGIGSPGDEAHREGLPPGIGPAVRVPQGQGIGRYRLRQHPQAARGHQRNALQAAPPAGRGNPPVANAGQGEPVREAGFNELVGLEGPIFVLLENAGTIIFATWAFMTAALWMPFMLGRLVTPMLLNWRDYLAGMEGNHPAALTAEAIVNTTAATNATKGVDSLEGLGPKLALLPLLNRLTEMSEVYISGPALSEWVSLGIGYAVLLLLATLAFWSLVVWKLLWRSNLREGVLGQRDIIRAAFADLSHQTRVHIGYAALTVKVTLVLTMELTLLPALHGCWVDVCLLPMFEGTWADRMRWLHASPLSFLMLHWMLGIAMLIVLATFLSILRQQLRPGSLPFFKDPYEGEDEPMRALMMLGLGQQLEREACALFALTCVTVVVVHLPLRLTKAVFPRVLPLQLTFSSPFSESLTDMLLFHFLLPLTVPRLRFLRQYVVRGTRLWLKATCKMLDLEDYLLPRPYGEPGPPLHQQLLPPPIIPLGIPGDTGNDDRPANWREELEGARRRSGRLLMLMAMLLATFILINAAILNMPLLTGRLLFRIAKLPKQHDLYNAALGAYSLWGGALITQQIHRISRTPSLRAAGQVAMRCILMCLRMTGMAVLGLGVLPILIGLFLELLVMPLRHRPGVKPSFVLYQDWAVGLLALKLGFRCLLGLPQLNQAPQEGEEGEVVMVRVLQPLKRLRFHLRRLAAIGLSQAEFLDVFRHVLWPLIAFWGAAVSAPYLLVKGLAARLPFLSDEALHIMFTNAWFVETSFLLGCLSGARLFSAIEQLGRKLRDQRYLLRRELMNVSES